MLSRRDSHHKRAVQGASENSPPWYTCEAVLSEACHLPGERGAPRLNAMLSRKALVARFNRDDNVQALEALLQKHASVPMRFVDACLVCMSETTHDPLIFTTDSTFASIADIAGRWRLYCAHDDPARLSSNPTGSLIVWLPFVGDYRTFLQNPAPDRRSVFQGLAELPMSA